MFPILYQNILTGFEHTDNKWIEMAKIFGKTSFQRFVSIYLPASKSFIFDGICTAMGFGWRAIIIGEVLAQPIHGIGTSMKQAQAYINLSEVIAWTIIAVVVSYLFDVIIKSIQKIHFEKKLPKASLFQIVSTCEMYELKEIKTQNMVKRFNDKLIIDSFNFVFDNVTVSCINGPSGKGKTTLIRLIAQLEKPDSGHIVLPESVHMAYCFQDIRLLPWLTVSENIAYAIHTKIIHKQEVSNLVSYLLDKMELSEHGHKYPHELSGGQQQRVDLARALAARSEILLFDEPLTGLDIDLKVRIVDFLSEWIAAYRPVVVWATHEDVHLSYTMVRKVFI
jgi:ABC-type nitrate/sulfonate/bicarbonate transport system ATPase subunit